MYLYIHYPGRLDLCGLGWFDGGFWWFDGGLGWFGGGLGWFGGGLMEVWGVFGVVWGVSMDRSDYSLPIKRTEMRPY